MSEVLFECRDLSFSYTTEKSREVILQGIDLVIKKGDMKCLTGPSGSGKSTLLNLFGLMEKSQKGLFYFQGKEVISQSENTLNHWRRFHIGFVFQDFQLIDVLSVEENVEFFLCRQDIPFRERQAIVKSALEIVGLYDFRHKRPNALSGGQKQRVAIARAIAKRPLVLIADEPTASLDTANARNVMEIISKLNRELGMTILVASHDPMILEFGLDEIRLKDGTIVQEMNGSHQNVG